MDLFRSTLKPVDKVLEDAYLKRTDVDDIILVGGSTKNTNDSTNYQRIFLWKRTITLYQSR